MEIHITKPELFSFQECLWFLNRNYDDCLHEIAADSLTKLIRLENQPLLIRISENKNELVVQVLNEVKPDAEKLAHYLTDWLDLNKDLSPFYALLQQETDLAFMTEQYFGLRLIAIPDLFEALGWSIIGQQINLPFAYTLKRRLTETYSKPLKWEGRNFYGFPAPETLAALPVAALRDLHFSTRKAEYLIGLAKLFAENKLSRTSLESLTDPVLIFKELVGIRGIGEWTANYALMKCLKLPNAIPHGDVGLFNALHQLKNFPKRPDRQLLDTFFEPFSGWKSYLVFYLWRSLSFNKATSPG